MKYLTIPLALHALALSPLALPIESPAYAQGGGGYSCMSRDRASGRFYILVPSNRTLEFDGRGFVERECSGRENGVGRYRNTICELANTASQESLVIFEQSFGVSAEELCAMVGGNSEEDEQ